MTLSTQIQTASHLQHYNLAYIHIHTFEGVHDILKVECLCQAH